MKEWIKKLLLLAVSVLFTALLCEFALRVYQKVRFGVPFSNDGLSQASVDSKLPSPQLPNLLDDRLGWRPTPYFQFKGEAQSADGSRYPISITKNKYGFRAFGQLETTKIKVLVVGDSFTEALEVSDDSTYYSILGKSMGFEMFAIGSGGYGSLQELMLLEEFMDRIRPDLILWQFCFNDFIDNSYELSLEWKSGGLALTRPFWAGKGITYRMAKPYPSFREFANKRSRLLYLVTTRLDILLSPPPNKDLLLDDIVTQGSRHRGFMDSVSITNEIMKMVKKRAGLIPVVVFEACTTGSPFYPALQEICRQNEISFVAELPGVLDKAQQRGLVIRSKDCIHWNSEGHRLVANVLSDYLRQANLPKQNSPFGNRDW